MVTPHLQYYRELVLALVETSQRPAGTVTELKQRMRIGRVRLHRLWNVGEQYLLAATAQNFKRLVRFLAQRPPKLKSQVS